METESIVFAVAAAAAIWGFAQIIIVVTQSDKKKLKQRLVRDSDIVPDSDAARSSVVLARENENIPRSLANIVFFQNLNRKLLQAFPDTKLSKFLMIIALMGGMSMVIVLGITESVGLGMMAGAGAGFLPIVFMNNRRGSRQKRLSMQLPEALDFLTRVLRAGHSLSTGLQMMGDELPDPISSEFRRAYAQHSLGQSLEDSMREMAKRIESSDFAFFVTAVLIQRQTGGDLSEVLQNISGMVRQRIRLISHVKAITAEGRLTSYVLVGFPAVLYGISYSLNPDYAGQLIRNDVGRMMLMGAVALQVVGFICIRKIVNVKV